MQMKVMWLSMLSITIFDLFLVYLFPLLSLVARVHKACSVIGAIKNCSDFYTPVQYYCLKVFVLFCSTSYYCILNSVKLYIIGLCNCDFLISFEVSIKYLFNLKFFYLKFVLQFVLNCIPGIVCGLAHFYYDF